MERTNTAVWLDKYHRWQINVQKDGVRRTFTCAKPGRTGQREANAKADAWLDDGIDKTSTRVDTLFDEFIVDLKLRTSKSDWHNEEARGKKWIKPRIGHRKVSSLNDQDLQGIINIAFSEGRLAKKSLQNLASTLKRFIKFCRKKKVTTYHPEDIIIPKGAASAEKQILQPEHLVTLFTIDTTLYRGAQVHDDLINAYRLSVLTGFRPGELIGLRDVDCDGNKVKIRRSINIYGEETRGKNDNAIRLQILPPIAKKVLDAQLMASDGPFLFEISNEQFYRQSWKRYCNANNIPYVPPYNLRHTFVSMIKTLPEGQVKQLVGHSRSMDTFGVYSHRVVGDAERTASDLEEIFTGLIEESKRTNELEVV